MTDTFKDLGMDFPLFEAPASECWQYVGKSDCDICNARDVPSFDDDSHTFCFECLRARKTSLTTEEQAEKGRTHGIPNLQTDMFPVVETDDPEWQAAVIPSEHLWELITTPTYSTWQGEKWLFCCARPMIYIGAWGKTDFEAAAPDGDAYQEAARMIATQEVDWWKGLYPDAMSFYAFRCSDCGKRRAHCDMD